MQHASLAERARNQSVSARLDTVIPPPRPPSTGCAGAWHAATVTGRAGKRRWRQHRRPCPAHKSRWTTATAATTRARAVAAGSRRRTRWATETTTPLITTATPTRARQRRAARQGPCSCLYAPPTARRWCSTLTASRRWQVCKSRYRGGWGSPSSTSGSRTQAPRSRTGHDWEQYGTNHPSSCW